jgi:hypothetical protein
VNKRRRNRRKQESGASPPSHPEPINPPRVAWRIGEWAAAVGCCKQTVYNLVADGELELVKLRGMSLVRPGPSEYLDRQAAGQN